MKRVVLLFSAASLLVLSLSGAAKAMPAFARQYELSCTTCHAPFPKLNDFGDEFAANGFTLSGEEASRYYRKTGDPNLDLIREFPLAIRFEGFGVFESETGRGADVRAPWGIKVLSGGALTKDVAYYFYFFLDERGEVAGLEDAYLMFNDLFGPDLDLYIGQFQVSDPLFKRELRLTFQDYQVYRTRPSDAVPGASRVNLTYDRGVMLTWGLQTGTTLTLEVLNGSGIGEANADRTYDSDAFKNLAGHVSQDVGDRLNIGAFGYWGQENDTNTDEISVFGPNLTLDLWKLELNLQYLVRRDSDPTFLADPVQDVETRGGFAELIFSPSGESSRWYGVALYNRVESDLEPLDHETVTGHLGYLLRTNIRFGVEGTYDLHDKEYRASLGFVTAF